VEISGKQVFDPRSSALIRGKKRVWLWLLFSAAYAVIFDLTSSMFLRVTGPL
jgi:hypothetical protein